MAARKGTTAILVANTSFTATVKGAVVTVHRGDRYRADHPVVKDRESLFDQAEADVKDKP
jgi:hypothetical protein